MSLTPTQLEELQSITVQLQEEFPSNQDFLWNAAIRIQNVGLGPDGVGGQPAFDALVADMVVTQEQVQKYQGRSGSDDSGFDVSVLSAIPASSTFPIGNAGDILYLDTPPNTFLATDQIQITPAGPNSVQMDEVGTTVARTVPAASGGLEINNLSTGAGFERALTTADLGGGTVVIAGTVDGQLLIWNAAGPDYSPTSDLLVNTGLFELQSNYTVVALGGIAIRNANGDVFLDNAILGGGLFQYSVAVGGNDGIRIRDNGLAQFGMSGGTQTTTLISGVEVEIVRNGVDQVALTLAPAAGGLSVNNTLTGAGLERVLTTGDLGGQVDSVVGGVNISVNAADPVNPIVNLDAAITGVSINAVTLSAVGAATNYLDETGAYSVPPSSGGVAAGTVTNATLRWSGAAWVENTGIRSVSAGAVRLEIEGSGAVLQLETTGAALDEKTTRIRMDNFAGFVIDSEFDSGLNGDFLMNANRTAEAWQNLQMSVSTEIFGSLYLDDAAGVQANILTQGQLYVDSADDSLHYRTGAGVDTDLIAGAFDPAANQTITGDWTFDNATFDLKLGVSTALFFRNPSDNSSTFIQNLGPTLQIGIAGADFGSGIFEIAASSFAKTISPPIFMVEQAAAEADVTSQGQLWMRTDAFSNTLMFTNDNGNDLEVGGLPYNGDVLNGSLSMSTTTFGGAANIGPKPDHFYMIIARGQMTTPDAADDAKVQLSVDTLSLFQGLYTDSNGQSVSMQSATGEVVTNTVVVDTDGSGVDDGTYFQIIGTLRTGANAQTVSLRVAKNANAGGNGLCSFPSISVIQLTE